MAVSQFSYILNCAVLPKDVLQNINKLIFNFLWDGRDKVARKTLIGEVGQGGLRWTRGTRPDHNEKTTTYPNKEVLEP